MLTQGSKTFHYLEEKKTISQEKYFLSSGERKGKSPNRLLNKNRELVIFTRFVSLVQ
jgi:hypothetical protein